MRMFGNAEHNNGTPERRHSKQPDEFPDSAEAGQVPSFRVEQV